MTISVVRVLLTELHIYDREKRKKIIVFIVVYMIFVVASYILTCSNNSAYVIIK